MQSTYSYVWGWSIGAEGEGTVVWSRGRGGEGFGGRASAGSQLGVVTVGDAIACAMQVSGGFVGSLT